MSGGDILWASGGDILWASGGDIMWSQNPGTQIPDISDTDFALRQAALIPHGWASSAALNPGGNFYALLETFGDGLAFLIQGITYALGSTRIGTAVAPELDLASEDFFGSDLPRNPGESDAAYALRILAAMFPTGATRQAVSDAVKHVTGVAPRIIEPWRPLDTGVWDGVAGHGMMFWDIDTIATPFRWTDPGLAYQGFVETIALTLPVLAGNPLNCFDDGFYWNVSGSSFFDFSGSASSGVAEIFAAINLVKVFGTIVWVRFIGTSPQVQFMWDGFGMFWDMPNVNWDI